MNEHSITAHPATPLPADNPARPFKIARPNTDETLPHLGLVGDTYTVLLSGADTNGRYCLIDMHVPPGGGPPPHRHDFEESFTVLEGEIETTFRGAKTTVHTGQTVSIPANAPHSFTNAAESAARLLCICAPAGQEEFFAQVGVLVPTRRSTPPKLSEPEQAQLRKKAAELAPSYRTELSHRSSKAKQRDAPAFSHLPGLTLEFLECRRGWSRGLLVPHDPDAGPKFSRRAAVTHGG